uniref:Conserved plasma membrane protein n=1 Tax=Panagrellus redivivus TaxID=6233 RepID=A0A7E4UVR9_PANRE
MVRVHSQNPRPRIVTADAVIEFNHDDAEYYPAACCEALHVKNAVIVSTALQIIFCCLLGFLYIYLDHSGFLRAVDICRTSMILLFICNVIGLICALVGVFLERIALVQLQTVILTSLVVISDLMALGLVLIMAIGKRNYTTANLPGVFVDTDRVEYVLGPFWIYLIAIMLHMAAAATMCSIGVYNRYLKYLRSKNDYDKLSTETPSNGTPQPNPTVVTVTGEDS